MLLQLFRVATLVTIAWIMREHHLRVERDADAPLTLAEIRAILPEAAALEPERSDKNGFTILDAAQKPIGLAMRTLPEAGKIVGYRGWTDCLIVLDPALKVIAVKIRDSQDTREHVGDIREDRSFLRSWKGRTWNELLNLDPREAGIDGVSGASMTSEAIVEGILRRIQSTRDTGRQVEDRESGGDPRGRQGAGLELEREAFDGGEEIFRFRFLVGNGGEERAREDDASDRPRVARRFSIFYSR